MLKLVLLIALFLMSVEAFPQTQQVINGATFNGGQSRGQAAGTYNENQPGSGPGSEIIQSGGLKSKMFEILKNPAFFFICYRHPNFQNPNVLPPV